MWICVTAESSPSFSAWSPLSPSLASILALFFFKGQVSVFGSWVLCPPLFAVSLGGECLCPSLKWNKSIDLLRRVCCVSLFSHVRLFGIPWTVAHQAPLSMGILQARILEWVAYPSSRGSSQPRDRTQVSHIPGGFFTI